MATVSGSFQELIRRIQPLQSEIDAAEGHLATIKTRLEYAFSLKKFFTAGSYGRNTFIRGKSDVDAFAVISLDDIKWGNGWKSSFTILDNFRAELAARFPYSSVYRDVHAIVVEFTDCKVDVVPAVWAEFSEEYKRPIYWIPDGNGDWMRTSPELHNDYIKKKNDESGGKLRTVAQMMKFWRECRNPRIPLSSFHIEIVLASENICYGIKSYADCVTELLQSLAARDCAGIRDPFGICGIIPAVKTEAQRAGATASVKNSRDHAKAALSAALYGNTNEALRQWDIVFNSAFPYA